MSRQKFEEEMAEFIRERVDVLVGEVSAKYPDTFVDMRLGGSDSLGIRRRQFAQVRCSFEEAIKSAIRWKEWLKG